MEGAGAPDSPGVTYLFYCCPQISKQQRQSGYKTLSHSCYIDMEPASPNSTSSVLQLKRKFDTVGYLCPVVLMVSFGNNFDPLTNSAHCCVFLPRSCWLVVVVVVDSDYQAKLLLWWGWHQIAFHRVLPSNAPLITPFKYASPLNNLEKNLILVCIHPIIRVTLLVRGIGIVVWTGLGAEFFGILLPPTIICIIIFVIIQKLMVFFGINYFKGIVRIIYCSLSL